MSANMTPQGTLSLPVQHAAHSQQLGPFIKTYKTTFVRTIIGSFIFLAAAIGFFIGSTTIQDSAEMRVKIILLVFAVGFLAMTIYMAYSVIQVINQQIHLFQQGIVIEKGSQVQVFPWNQASEVWQSITRRYQNGVYVGTTYLYTLRRTDGYQIKLNNLTKNVSDLGPAVAKGITQALVPRALSAISAGQTLTFAPFSINLQGINDGRELIPWSQVQAVDVSAGRLSIKKVGSKATRSVAVAKIPNFLVFTIVAEQIQGMMGSRR